MTTPIYTHEKSLNTRRNVWLEKSNIKHNFKYKYPFLEDDFVNAKSYIMVECPEHGLFKVRGDVHLGGSICKKCFYKKLSLIKTKSQDQFIEDVILIWGDKNEYGLYKGTRENIDIHCNKHDIDYKQIAGNLLFGKEGCPKCSEKGYSKISIEWLNSLNNTNICHALNGGEYKIIKNDGSFYKADGYDPTTNTVYEFHGDIFHGNPLIFDGSEKCNHHFPDTTASELYDKTIERENEIKYLGYNLVVMWESDYLARR